MKTNLLKKTEEVRSSLQKPIDSGFDWARYNALDQQISRIAASLTEPEMPPLHTNEKRRKRIQTAIEDFKAMIEVLDSIANKVVEKNE